MTPGNPTADMMFECILTCTAGVHELATETGTEELRRALAALSTFRGPGTIARDLTVALIRNELEGRA